jgi:DNA-binding CsgD family transcriptional regulator
MQQVVRTSVLTPRPDEIAALIAAGFTNGEIADRLGLTRGVVSEHIGNIRWRLGLTRRCNIAAWTIEQAWHMGSDPFSGRGRDRRVGKDHHRASGAEQEGSPRRREHSGRLLDIAAP